MTGAPARVFISYSHDTVAHQQRVLDLADRLRADGIDAEIDQYNLSPPDGWPLWCERQIEAACAVLMVCTETYHRRVRGEEAPGQGLGVVWEARIIRQLLYDAGAISGKFVPVLFSDGSPDHIPTPIKGWSRYVVDSGDGYDALYRRLSGQPPTPRPRLGPTRTLPPRTGRWAEGETAPSPPAPSSPVGGSQGDGGTGWRFPAWFGGNGGKPRSTSPSSGADVAPKPLSPEAGSHSTRTRSASAREGRYRYTQEDLVAELERLAEIDRELMNNREDTVTASAALREWKKRVATITGSDEIYKVEADDDRKGKGMYGVLRNTMKKCRQYLENIIT